MLGKYSHNLLWVFPPSMYTNLFISFIKKFKKNFTLLLFFQIGCNNTPLIKNLSAKNILSMNAWGGGGQQKNNENHLRRVPRKPSKKLFFFFNLVLTAEAVKIPGYVIIIYQFWINHYNIKGTFEIMLNNVLILLVLNQQWGV